LPEIISIKCSFYVYVEAIHQSQPLLVSVTISMTTKVSCQSFIGQLNAF